jgi:hypothetical protein
VQNRALFRVELCKFFARGECHNEFCSFAHGEAQLQSKQCIEFINTGSCRRVNCKFQHMRPKNDQEKEGTAHAGNSSASYNAPWKEEQYGPPAAGGNAHGSSFQTKLCAPWREGRCPYPDHRCFYAHGASRLNCNPCSKWRTATCAKGELCTYSHSQQYQ